MNKLFTATLLTIAAVPFLMAAPKAAAKPQTSAPAANQTDTSTPKPKAKKHVKKAKSTTTTAAPAAAPSK
jgi:hypothetical protein